MPIIVAGLGFAPEHIPAQVRELLPRAGLIAAGHNCLELIAAERGPLDDRYLPLDRDLAAVFAKLWDSHTAGQTVLLLASGDPLFFGAATALRRWLESVHGAEATAPDVLRIIPNISSMQVMAARLGLPWSDLPCVSLHGRSDWFPLWQALAQASHRHICLLTDNTYTPAHVANALLGRGCVDTRLHIFSRLGSAAEEYFCLPLKEARDYDAPKPNALILERGQEPGLPLTLGQEDDSFTSEAGLISKGPARAMALAALRLNSGHVLWDLGAGSGAVSMEAAALLPQGCVFAVERDARRAEMIFENRQRCGAWQVEIVNGEMPACLDSLPAPDRIFIGGGLNHGDLDSAGNGRGVNPLLAEACRRLRPGGRLVANCVLQSSLNAALDYFQQLNWPVETTLLQASQSRPLAGSSRFNAQNPVFVLTAVKP